MSAFRCPQISRINRFNCTKQRQFPAGMLNIFPSPFRISALSVSRFSFRGTASCDGPPMAFADAYVLPIINKVDILQRARREQREKLAAATRTNRQNESPNAMRDQQTKIKRRTRCCGRDSSSFLSLFICSPIRPATFFALPFFSASSQKGQNCAKILFRRMRQ